MIYTLLSKIVASRIYAILWAKSLRMPGLGGGCHLPKYYTFGFGMVFKFLGQLLKQSNVFGNKITRFGVNG